MKLIMKAELSCQHHIPDCEALVTKKCANPHGHNYQVTLRIPVNFAKYPFLDFAIVKKIAWSVFEKYDHHSLDDYDIHTVEQFASRLWVELHGVFAEYLADKSIELEIMETVNYGVTFP